MGSIALAAIAILPTIFLCVFIYKKDSVEKEPIGLLLLLFILGAVACVPAVILETLAEEWLGWLYSVPLFGLIISNFLGVALVEEWCKRFFLHRVTRNNPAFDYMFDAVVYSVFVSLGFAAFENIFYVFDDGFGIGILRAITSIPGHMFFSIAMGYFYGRWNVFRRAETYYEEVRKVYLSNGVNVVNPFIKKRKRYMRLMLLIPTLLHGIYDYLCDLSDVNDMYTLALIAFVVAMYIFFFICISKLSKSNMLNANAMMEALHDNNNYRV